MALEVWALEHPNLGRIELQLGYDQDFIDAARDGSEPEAKYWPEEGQEYQPLEVGDSLVVRARKRMANPPLRAQIVVDGRLHRRLSELPDTKIPLSKRLSDRIYELSTVGGPVKKGEPSLKVQRNVVGEVQLVTLHNGPQVVELDPPAGSRGEDYHQAMETSAVKRVAFPLLAGLGKGGWALFIILFGSVFSRIVDWLLSLLPDWDLPDWQLPQPPNIALPVPHPPKINLPVIDWPEWNLPDLPEIPAWLELLMSYTKVWVPVLIGIVIGVIAMRNHKKSEASKLEWQAQLQEGESRESGEPPERASSPERPGSL